MSRPRVEILYFDGCPNHEATRALVERIGAELQLDPEVELIQVTAAEAASQLRFLGSPSVRVNARDIEPGADERGDFVFSCRVYRSGQGFAGQPDESWIREALTEAASADGRGADAGSELPAGVAAALATAQIPASKLGPARRARLTDSERELYLWILHHFRTRGLPRKAETRAAAELLGIVGERALDALAREDLVHRGPDGEITVAYPFSGRPTGHRVRFPGGHEVNAMCALDALGIAPMFEAPIDVDSRDPVSGHEIRARVAPDGAAEWWPDSAVVVGGVLDRQSHSCRGCCPVLNLFATAANGERWLAEHPEVRGNVISMDEASWPESRLRRRAHEVLMPTPIDRRELQRLQADEQAQLVEVLPAAECEDEHLPGAVNIPLKEVNADTARQPGAGNR